MLTGPLILLYLPYLRECTGVNMSNISEDGRNEISFFLLDKAKETKQKYA